MVRLSGPHQLGPEVTGLFQQARRTLHDLFPPISIEMPYTNHDQPNHPRSSMPALTASTDDLQLQLGGHELKKAATTIRAASTVASEPAERRGHEDTDWSEGHASGRLGLSYSASSLLAGREWQPRLHDTYSRQWDEMVDMRLTHAYARVESLLAAISAKKVGREAMADAFCQANRQRDCRPDF
ncbi:unnamed protein product [Protopolystoma xenopodis]|uniref:Uncharacterized protein n=1 Tax=Protopolystoma xenopodis TaxID=117903 RepID=A0A448XGP3_9PLAT|nr:unnamed protein product [Protopolystoma xenopodis]